MLPLSDNFEDSRSAVQLTLAARVGLRKGTLLDEALMEQWFGLSDVELTWGNPDTNLAFFVRERAKARESEQPGLIG